jgi:hypothetical protein
LFQWLSIIRIPWINRYKYGPYVLTNKPQISADQIGFYLRESAAYLSFHCKIAVWKTESTTGISQYLCRPLKSQKGSYSNFRKDVADPGSDSADPRSDSRITKQSTRTSISNLLGRSGTPRQLNLGVFFHQVLVDWRHLRIRIRLCCGIRHKETNADGHQLGP